MDLTWSGTTGHESETLETSKYRPTDRCGCVGWCDVGCVHAHWEDFGFDNEHCWCDQGLDADLLQLLRFQGAPDVYKSVWIRLLL
jgi:hypothetical protein